MSLKESTPSHWLVVAELLFFAVSSFRMKRQSGDLTLRELISVFYKHGYKLGVEYFLENYLLDRYRLRVKIVLGQPSISFFKKFDGFFSSTMLVRLASRAPSKTRVLLMREGAMGDVIMLTPIIRQLYMQRRGNVSIDVVTAFGAVFDNNPYVHSIIPVGAAKRVVRTYDMVIDFNGLYERDLSEHPVRSYAKHAFGDDSFPKKLDIFYKDADVNFVKAKLKEFKVDGAYLVCHKPNHDWPNRNLPNEFWIDFLKKLSKSTGKKIIQVGSSSDFALRNESNIYDQRGLYDLQKLAALINMSSGFVGVDAGPSHIAASTNAPIFTFYTCAHHEARMPLRDSGVFIPITPNVECYGCMQRVSYPRPGYFCETGDNKCVEAFSATNAVELISDAISNPC